MKKMLFNQINKSPIQEMKLVSTLKTCLMTMVLGLLVLNNSTLYAQTQWSKDPNNPVLKVGPTGSWDDQLVGLPSVIFEGTTYHMWYAGYDGSNGRIGHATSPDGITWTKDTLNPVLDLGPAGSWEDSWVYFPSVVFDGSTFHMWYTGTNGGTPSPYRERIGYATSPDGVTWTKDTLNPVLDVGPTGSWEDYLVASSFVRFDGTLYHMWYTGGYNDYDFRIGHATSPDGVTWTKDTLNPVLHAGPVGSWDNPRVQDSRVIFDGTEYHMWYSGGGIFTWRIGHATSPDGVTWTKDTLNPVLDVGTAGSWDDRYLECGSVLYDTTNSTYELWYGGGRIYFTGSIGYATSTKPGVGINDSNTADVPQRFLLSQNYPNPFNPVTTMRYDLPEASEVTLTIYDILGRRVRTLVQGMEEPGYKSVMWDGTNDLGQQVSAGVYLYRIQAGNFTQTRKMVLLR